MEVYKSLERPAYVAGVPFLEFGSLVCLFLGLAVLGAMARMIMPVPGWYYLACLGLVSAFYGVVRWATLAGRPQFLASWIAFHFAQPGRIEMDIQNVNFPEARPPV